MTGQAPTRILKLQAPIHKEAEHGLTYTAFSRETKLSYIGIIGGLSGDRLTTKLSRMKKVRDRKAEDDRLKQLQLAMEGARG